jgi:potassium efflux system protein
VSAAAEPLPRRRLILAPGLRLARIVWRLLPALGWVVVAWFAARFQLLVVSGVFLTYWVVGALIREILSPDRPWLRVLPVSDLRAHRLDIALRLVLFFVLVSQVAIHLVESNGLPVAIADVARVLRNLVLTIAGFTILGTTGFYRWLRESPGDGALAVLGRYFARVVFPVALLTLLVWSTFRGLGYHPLASWVLDNTAWSLLKILAAVLVYRWIKTLLYRSIRFYTVEEPSTPGGGIELNRAGTYALGVVRISLGIVGLGLVCLTFFWILRNWSLSGATLLEGLRVDIPGVGGLTWAHLLLGLARVAATIWIGWLIRSVLTYFFFPRSQIGVGGRYAILAVLRYSIVAIALVFGLSALGIDMGSLSWFFGAAGIGLAFGLQDIIGNFVSGLIMLVERPIRVGDVVQIGTETGAVEEIRMRGTTLRTFDNTTLLIPNSQMLGERVTNLTHGLGHARVKIPVIAPHDVDMALMESILLEAAASNEDVLADPAPFVWLSEFSPSSLDFTLVCFTPQLRARFSVASQVRLKIMEGMRAAGIHLPYPQQQVHISADLPPGVSGAGLRSGFGAPGEATGGRRT